MRIVSMKKNKGTIEIETERRFYVIDFLNDKILSNGQEIKKLSRDFFQACYDYHEYSISRSGFGTQEILSKFVYLRENNFKEYRDGEAFLSMALQYPELDYNRAMYSFFANYNKLTKDYLEWCKKEEEPVNHDSINRYKSIKAYSLIPKDLKPYFAIILAQISIESLELLNTSTLLKLLRIVKYTTFHSDNPKAVYSKLSELIRYLTIYNISDELLNTNRTVFQNYKTYQVYDNESKEGKIGLELRRLNFMNGSLFDGNARNSHVVIIPQTLEDLIDEGKQQNNCVGHYYNESILRGENLILFIRHSNSPKKSYITCRYNIKKQDIVECKYKNNQDVNGYDMIIIKKAAEMIRNNLK
nr:MAG TPA: PcfJ like protein [Caudoviricetes sp.]